MNTSGVLAVIPARGGSKGIPRKNVRLLAGKPLIAHTIDEARRASCVDRVVVSTDDPEIASAARQHGAEVVWRPAELSGDTASSEAALLHTLDRLHTTEGYTPELLVFLQCTSPLTSAEDIDGCVKSLLDQQADTALAVTPFHYFTWRPGIDGDAVAVNHDKRVRPLRQHREPQYLETGAVYVMRTAGFLQARHRFFGRTALYVMPQERCLEIDEPIDFEHAEVRMLAQSREARLARLPEQIDALFLDFDGVLTDNQVVTYQDGSESVSCDRSDGLGIAALRLAGVPVSVLSTERNPVVAARCRKLGIDCLQGLDDKGSELARLLVDRELDPQRVVFVGNDVNDLSCMAQVGCSVAVADAVSQVRAAARLVLAGAGGHGAVRELCDMIVQRRSINERND